MGDKTEIAWTDATWNPVRGCSVVSDGCENCYAMRQAHRMNHDGGAYFGTTRMTAHGPKWNGKVKFAPSVLRNPLRWTKPRHIFVNSMSDLFHEKVGQEWIDRIFAVMALGGYSPMRRNDLRQTPRHTFQVLTKRPERMRDYMNDPTTANRVWLEARKLDPCGDGRTVYRGHLRPAGEWQQALESLVPPEWPLPWVHLGISAENQETLDQRAPILFKTRAAVRFISAEPLLGPMRFDVDSSLSQAMSKLDPREVSFPVECLDWVIVGGESGPGARLCEIKWIRSIVEQMKGYVPCFVKQLGAKPVGACVGPLFGDNPREDQLDPHYCDAYEASEGTCGRICQYRRSRKGTDMTEWPEDLRVQEMPV